MIISCPKCHARYRIDPASSSKAEARVKCPGCQHVFAIALQSETVAATTASTRPRVLIVDDARFFREMIKDILGGLPLELEEAADGNLAWQKIVEGAPQLVLLDLNIPGRSGQELLQELRKRDDLSSVRVLAMSGVLRDEAAVAQVRSQGADDFISKSFTPRELQNRVCKILGL